MIGIRNNLESIPFGENSLASKMASNLSQNLCAASDSPDGFHHASKFSAPGGKDEHGAYNWAVCNYCGANFKVYPSDLKDAYNDYVKTNSGSDGSSFGVNSSGQYIVYPELMGALEYYRTSDSGTYVYPKDVLQKYLGASSLLDYEKVSLVSYEDTHLYRQDNLMYYYAYVPVFRFVAPFDCSVKSYAPSYIYKGGTYKTSSTLGGGYSTSIATVYNGFYPNGGSALKGEGFYMFYYLYDRSTYVSQYTYIKSYRPIVSFGLDLSSVYFVLTPLTSNSLPGSSTRPTTYIKNIYNITNNTTINNVFNETNNTYIDASTGDTYNVTNWEYNYASRFYSFTYDGSDGTTHTVVITYADDFVTVTDNGTTNYYYYGFDSDPGTGGGGSSGGDSSGGSGGDSSGGSSSGGSSSGIDYTPAINDIIEKLQTLIEQGDANSEYLQKVLAALDSINSNTKDTYLTLLDLLNRVNTGLNYTDDSGQTYTVSELAYYIYRYLQDNLDTKVSGISALLDKILKAIESISPNINVDVDIDGDGEADSPETWFSGFLGKFAFIGTLYDCAKQLVADITNDAASAQAVSAGVVSVDDLSSDHAPQATADSDEAAPTATYTNPEVLLNLPSVSWRGVDFSGMSALNLSWYAPYKPTVDAILSGFLWLAFLWTLIKRAPGIIQGASMVDGAPIGSISRR